MFQLIFTLQCPPQLYIHPTITPHTQPHPTTPPIVASLMDTLDKIHNENIVMEKTLHLLSKRRDHLLNVNYRLGHPAHPTPSSLASDNAAALAAAAIMDSQVYAKFNAAAAMVIYCICFNVNIVFNMINFYDNVFKIYFTDITGKSHKIKSISRD